MAQHKTRLKKLHIRKFRALQDVHIEFGTHVTVICGKNGTSKSSILGIAAQIFSFEKDYVKDEALTFTTVTGEKFKSLPAEHFRFSSQYDVPGSMDVAVELFDGYTQSEATADLSLSKRSSGARPVVRKNSTVEAGGNQSRNFTHPVIFLSLARLIPIATRVNYKPCSFDYLTANRAQFITLNNKLLNKAASAATGTSGSISSAVAHAANYDQDSVSAGEDNAGQIVLALMSFRKLKEEYADYKGGLLLIDEADAGLFPAAQTALIKMLDEQCTELNLQVVMTSHSPGLIEQTFDLSKRFQRKFKTIYLSDTYGSVRSMHDMSWPMIFSDLNMTTVAIDSETAIPQVNVYFEDNEGKDFFDALTYRHRARKLIRTLDVSLGCSNYLQLISKGVEEFSKKSIVVLDGDVQKPPKATSVVLLPTSLPPDQLLFEFLFNRDASDSIWKNSIQFTRPIFRKVGIDIISALQITGEKIDLPALVKAYRKKSKDSSDVKLRDLFKAFYKDAEFQKFLNLKPVKDGPWRCWLAAEPEKHEAFKTEFVTTLQRILREAFGVDTAKLVGLNLD